MQRISSVLLLALAACASGGTAEPGVERINTHVTVPGLNNKDVEVITHADRTPSSTPVAIPAERAFALLPAAYQSLGIEVAHNDPASRTLGNREVTAVRKLGNVSLSQYLRCGDTVTGAAAVDSYRVRMSVLTTVQPTGTGSELRTDLRAYATAPGRNDPQECFSTGRLETAIARAVSLGAAGQ